MTSPTPDMPASQLFDEIFSRWQLHFEQQKNSSPTPDEQHQELFEYSHRAVAEYSRRLMRELGAPFQQLIDDAVYALAALIDETVLYSDGPACALWQHCPLEYHLWQTHSAGDLIPQKIDALLTARLPGHRDLAAVWLRCLTLGFGSRRAGFDREAHQERCRLLWHFAFQRDAAPQALAQQMASAGLGAPLRLPAHRRLPDNTRLHLVAIVALLALLLLSQRLWLSIDEAIGVTMLPDFAISSSCTGENP